MTAMRSAGRRASASMADVELDDAAVDPEAPSPVGDRAIRTMGWALVALFSCVAIVVAVASSGSEYPTPPPVPGVVGAFGSAIPPSPEDMAAAQSEKLQDHGGLALEPGLYLASVAGGGPHPLVPVLSVPDGFNALEDGIGVRAGGQTFEGRVVWVWDIAGVYTHPCDAGKVSEIVGPSVADLATALAAQPLRDGTQPVPITIDGHRGLYVEQFVPDGTDVTACAGGRFDSWTEEGNTGARWQQGPGQIDKLWILDVDGDRITIAASHWPVLSPESVQEVERIATTARFVPVDMT